MDRINKLNIWLNNDGRELVGQMILSEKDVLFKYSQEYLNSKFNISPLKLRFNDSVQKAGPVPFKGLFGVFADSLPDAWGYLLMRKHLSKNQIAIETLNALEELAFVGNNALGALSYTPCYQKEQNTINELDLDNFNHQASKILEGEPSEIIEQLVLNGGSPGGARPKIYVGYREAPNSLIYGHYNLPDGYDNWIVKFPAAVDPKDIANIEMAYHHMAVSAGIKMTECKLLEGASGQQYFGTKRFDRAGNDRVHMVSAAGLLHDDYEKSQLDYGTLMHEGAKLVGSAEVHEQILRLAAFNVFAHNRDDHSKNFAFLMNKQGNWSFAPAYDLTFSSSSQGQHSTTCARNGIDPGTKELMSLADHFSVRNGKLIIQEVKEAVSNWKTFAQESGVSNSSKKTIDKTIRDLLER